MPKFKNLFLCDFLLDGICQCGPEEAACDFGRICTSATGVTYGDPNAAFECTCSSNNHCPNTTDTCNVELSVPTCTCGIDPPCDAPRVCLNNEEHGSHSGHSDMEGQPQCSCLDVSHCLNDTADTCDTAHNPPRCECTANILESANPCDVGIKTCSHFSDEG